MEQLNDVTIQSLIELGRLSAGPQMAPGANIPYVLNGDGKPTAMPELLFNEHNANPERIKGNVTVLDPASFCEYWGLFDDGSSSRVFANEPALSVVGVLDYHVAETEASAQSPRWCQHRVTLTLRESEQWKVWFGSNNKQMTQQAFAEFLEQHSIDISAPPPGAMMEIARDLNATTEAEFAAGIRMQDGQVKFKYTETVRATVGAGTLAIPEHFTISLPVFIGAPDVGLAALFRFRVKEGHLVVWYTLVRPEEAKRRAFLAARDEIASKLGIVIINGSPA